MTGADDNGAMTEPSSRRDAAAAVHRLSVMLVLGFASGLPLALSGPALQAWLTMDGLDVSRIGFITLVSLPYTLKFLWAPLMDRLDLPLLGRRRGWIVLTQALLALALLALADASPVSAMGRFAALGVVVAFLSASQDVVVDAYGTDVLTARERGLGSSLKVLGYRIAMILSGSIILIWTDPINGSGLSWPQAYRVMAAIMAGMAAFSALALPRVAMAPVEAHDPGRPPLARDLYGLLAVVAAVALGVFVTRVAGARVAGWLLSPWVGAAPAAGSLAAKWIDLASLLLGLAFTLPLAAFAARRGRFVTLLAGLDSFFRLPHAWGFLGLIVFYKLTNAFELSLITTFLLKGVGFAPAEAGVVNKLFGLVLTLVGAVAGGALMMRLRLARSLLVFGILQALSNLGFWWLALHGKGTLPGFVMPAMDLGFVHLTRPTSIDGGLLLAVAGENLASGMGSAAFVALLMGLTNRRFSATQYALLSAFASIGPVWVGPLAGVLVEAIGWPAFFLVSMASALPSLVFLKLLWRPIQALDAGAGTS